MSPVAANWRWPTRWQWLAIVWIVALNAAPYGVGLWASGDFGSLDWMIWSMLSGPFAHTAMLSFFLIAGGPPMFVRRITFVAGLLAMMGMIMLILDDNAVGTIAWFLLEALVVMALTLSTTWLCNVPQRPQRWLPQFSLAEILCLSGLLGIFLFMLRVADATDLQYWRSAQELAFIIFAISSGVYLFPICLTTIFQRRARLIAMILFSLLLWPVLPLIVLGALIAFEKTSPLDNNVFLVIFFPVFAVQMLLAWGTFFPMRVCFPGLIDRAPAEPPTAARCKSDTLADVPESYPQSEHTDVPD
ncbi:hypothetical protein AB1K70_22885 [Bremerella sp. JC770]|uniref:hypothetical protein n=1 Tax=Bremerella sp. JC770 TaxID=3232137 RepID=UPI00345AC000